MIRRARPVTRALAAALLAALAGCGAPATTAAPAPSAAVTQAPASVLPGATPSPPAVTAAQPSAATGSAPVATGVEEDPSLIAVLPADVGGVPVTLEAQAFSEAITDRAFAANIASAAFGVVGSGNDVASAVVASPVKGVYSDAWFRDWRETYDQGVCGQSGGVARTAQAELGGRTVYITTCAVGLRTYHTWIAARGLVVSVTSLGENGFGERLMAGLRP